MNKIEKIIEELIDANEITSDCGQEYQNFVFLFDDIIQKIEKNKLKKEDRAFLCSILQLFYDLNLYD